MNQSTHYNLNLVEGTDIVNPLVQDVPNYEAIDEAMYNNKIASVGTATELVSGVVHALTRATSDTPVFRFTATSNFNAGETFTVDGVQVTALTPSGETLVSGAYIIGSEVLCALRDTLLTVFVSGQAIADNALNLNGHPDTYFGTAEDVAQAQATATASGVLAQSVQTQVNSLEQKVDLIKDIIVLNTTTPSSPNTISTVNYPSGLNADNCVLLSATIQYKPTGAWYDNLNKSASGVEPILQIGFSNSIEIYLNSNSSQAVGFIGAPIRLVIMKL